MGSTLCRPRRRAPTVVFTPILTRFTRPQKHGAPRLLGGGDNKFEPCRSGAESHSYRGSCDWMLVASRRRDYVRIELPYWGRPGSSPLSLASSRTTTKTLFSDTVHHRENSQNRRPNPTLESDIGTYPEDPKLSASAPTRALTSTRPIVSIKTGRRSTRSLWSG